MKRAHIITVGNAKGGCGKSTSAMHVAARLLALKFRVGIIDLDVRQQTLARYCENRRMFAEERGVKLLQPTVRVVPEVAADGTLDESEEGIYQALCAAVEALLKGHDFIILDCPGSDNFAARLGHGFADTLLTPVNDSFIDLDLLAHVAADGQHMVKPGWYSEMVWTQRKKRYLKDRHKIDWVVMRNRLSQTEARNKRNVGDMLSMLAPRLGFRQVHGLGERVIFRELFLRGLTLCDLKVPGIGVPLTMQHVAAHQEVRDIVQALLAGRPAEVAQRLQAS